ncbi:MAG: peptide-methionine (S)-S-oxide reductase [Nitrosomonadaceae bacterium]|nr:peptide-methionine (S)-S-oxide reductase [Nitrosomonadaceae bacterium]|tara:strand:+ start:50 stop:547 length:498 start_codon:yes stop_codon:yes gene_type:complete
MKINTKEKVLFGAGCFWSVEASLSKIPGVNKTICGYSGGHTKNPTYNDICTGKTGHAEVVQVEYDPSQITYNALLTSFWKCHNPTTLNQQGPDIGSQYRSAIFYYTQQQQIIANSSKIELQSRKYPDEPIVTEILPATKFYRAEEYHQKYFEKHDLINTYNPNSQ